MAKCKVCEYCGASLDFGEQCDCRDWGRAGAAGQELEFDLGG